MPPGDTRPEASEVTLLLSRWGQGDQTAFDRACELVYPELRRIADAYLRRERSDHTLQPTALIHEAYLRFSGAGELRFENRKQFFALAAQLMRQILVDHARAIKAQKRGGDIKKVPLDTVLNNPGECADQFLLIHDLLDELKALNPRKARIIELRYFGGLTLEETAEVLETSRASAHREQRLALAWLQERIAH